MQAGRMGASAIALVGGEHTKHSISIRTSGGVISIGASLELAGRWLSRLFRLSEVFDADHKLEVHLFNIETL